MKTANAAYTPINKLDQRKQTVTRLGTEKSLPLQHADQCQHLLLRMRKIIFSSGSYGYTIVNKTCPLLDRLNLPEVFQLLLDRTDSQVKIKLYIAEAQGEEGSSNRLTKHNKLHHKISIHENICQTKV